VDDNGKDVEEGKPGELLVKGPVVTKGYYGNPQATKDAFVDGWFCTGDIAIWKNGMPYIVDRKKVGMFSITRTIANNKMSGTHKVQRPTGCTCRA
jgi:long-subunit acyl-CoA synthetase (AMP-forming)